MRIDQILAGFSSGDAISNYAIELQKIFKSWGFASEIFVQPSSIDEGVADLCLPLTEHERYSSPDNILIYHFSIGALASEYFHNVPDVKIIIYHNITPAHYFAVVDPGLASGLARGREELLRLAPVTRLALGVSEYNRMELESAGFNNTGVIPLTIDWSGMDGKPDRSLINKYTGKGETILFVGRVVPNKKIEDLLKAFFYIKLIKPESRLVLLGKYRETPNYYEFLQTIIRELDLRDVIFTGHTTHAELLAYYQLADLFLCLSEHEGFCLPLMEAMHFGIPVLAYAAAAIPDTLADAGVLIKEKNYPAIAEMAASLCENQDLRKNIIQGQYNRLEEFRSFPLEEKLKELLSPWMI
jgi:L-malate glycosyltransferase